MLAPWMFVGFAGHRSIPAGTTAAAAAIDAALAELAAMAHSRAAAVSSCAEGADLLFVAAAVRLGLPRRCLLPIPISEFEADFSTDAALRSMRQAVAGAMSVHIERRTDTRTAAYLDCGCRVVDESDVLVAYWDGNPAAGEGGTGDIVAYARSTGKPLLWIHSVTGARTWERRELLGPFAEPERSDREETDLLGIEAIEAAYRLHDTKANHLRPHATNLSLLLIFMHQAATTVAIAGVLWSSIEGIPSTASWTKIVVLCAALVVPLFVHRAHHHWMSHRLRAELCRSALRLWALPFPERSFEALKLPGLEVFQRTLLLHRWLSPVPHLGAHEAAALYAEQRLAEQLNYFRRQADAVDRKLRLLRLGAACCTTLAVACGLAVALHWIGGGARFYLAAKFLSMTLPLGASALVGWMLAADLTRRAARFRELEHAVSNARTKVLGAATDARLESCILEVERTLALELWEWYATARNTASGH